jgi:hypothetical protein
VNGDHLQAALALKVRGPVVEVELCLGLMVEEVKMKVQRGGEYHQQNKQLKAHPMEMKHPQLSHA